MKRIIRKNGIMPEHLDPEQIGSIFRYIEEHPKRLQAERVAEILESLSSLREGSPKLEKMQTLARLRQLLSNYRWTAEVSPSSQGLVTIMLPAERGLSADDKWGYAAVHDLLDLVPYLGKTPRIRRCAECQRWFFAAKREDQQYCGANCRQRHYDTAPEIRASKKGYMRKYRADQKRLARNPKSGVGLRGSRKR